MYQEKRLVAICYLHVSQKDAHQKRYLAEPPRSVLRHIVRILFAMQFATLWIEQGFI